MCNLTYAIKIKCSSIDILNDKTSFSSCLIIMCSWWREAVVQQKYRTDLGTNIQRMLTDLLKLSKIAYGYTTHVQIKMNENDILIWIMNSCVGGSSNTCIVVWKCFCFNCAIPRLLVRRLQYKLPTFFQPCSTIC